MNRTRLVSLLEQYHTEFAEEQEFIPLFLTLLQDKNAFERDHFEPGHITGSAWIVDASRQQVLLTHHAKLHRWLQPGGHADGDDNVARVALREAEEETGLTGFKFLRDGIFDLDIHVIPARQHTPEHLHYDIRFLLEANRSEALTITEESHALAWTSLAQLEALTNNNTSMMRMAEKVRRLFGADQQ